MKERVKILIVDDEPNIRRILEVSFDKAGFQPIVAEDGAQALELLGEHEFGCVLTDVTMPGMNGYELLREIRGRTPALPVVIMTAFGTIPQAVQAIRDGAFEYVTKPFDLDALKRVVQSALDWQPEAGAKSAARRPKKRSFQLIAESSAMRDVVQTAEQVADSRATVLITGESGVGKEVVARLLHEASGRAHQPYVPVSCAALPETLLESELFGYEKGAFTGAQGAKPGRFEMAHEGTLFLDEVGEIPPSIQVKLLRVLQEREFERLGARKPTKVDVRLITATNRDLREAVEQGTFRLDLLYRLQVVEVHIPPLRERTDDIRPLAEHFLAKYAAENGRATLAIGDAALAALRRYAWPGNVRELENTMERAVVLSAKGETSLSPALLPPTIREAA
ncbi:MAG: sigma-54 dependent transcriptional regulator [Fimbriimonadaceae bacterium]|nr:sigma-54-dependent Fis family transcriptional regulator [Chthonomonadaceae bacterium]MCO5296544.1 sigma-54 dependent transcriptional regulator [Fimbriimonadaceae bacterium]